jgi:esterase/lipase superfamily enzyme
MARGISRSVREWLSIAPFLLLFISVLGCGRKPASQQSPTTAKSAPSPPAIEAQPLPQTLPPPPPPPAPAPVAAADGHRPPAPTDNYAVVRVFYATDRQPTGNQAPGEFYGSDRSPDESIHLGTLDVSIPRDHRMGAIERPSIWKLEFREDPAKHVVLLSVSPQPEADFYRDLSAKVASSPEKDAFVFIHGFDNTFEQAAWRTAQLSYDLGFKGAPILYTWPSKGELADYPADEATVEWSTPHLQKFLEAVASQSHATTIHLIAHSMGNRAMTGALKGIAQSHQGMPPMFKEVFLAAPDIDVGVFRQLAAVFPLAATHVTLYASSHDEALAASRHIHEDERAGDSSPICVVPNIDTIDATQVSTDLIGHSYFGDNRSILSDIVNVMGKGLPPGQRFGMHVIEEQQLKYWIFQP